MKRDITDSLFSKLIRLLENHTCRRCGAVHSPNSQGLHTAHFHSRAKKSTRWDRANACALCYGCHQYIDLHKEEKIEFFLTILGREQFDALELRAKTIRKFTPDDIKALRQDLRDKIRRLE